MDQLAKVLWAIYKTHRVPQNTLDCRSGLGGLYQVHGPNCPTSRLFLLLLYKHMYCRSLYHYAMKCCYYVRSTFSEIHKNQLPHVKSCSWYIACPSQVFIWRLLELTWLLNLLFQQWGDMSSWPTLNVLEKVIKDLLK